MNEEDIIKLQKKLPNLNSRLSLSYDYISEKEYIINIDGARLHPTDLNKTYMFVFMPIYTSVYLKGGRKENEIELEDCADIEDVYKLLGVFGLI